MTTAVFNKVDYTLDQLLSGIELGSIGLPDIQRPFVWSPTRVRDLFDSMYQGYPVGYLLFWKNDQAEPSKVIGLDAKQKPPDLLIVDGQQRLTSLYSVFGGHPVLRDDYSEQRLHIAFNPLTDTFAVTDAAVRKNPEYISDISTLWTGSEGLYAFITAFLEQVSASRDLSPEEQKRIPAAITRLHELEKYPFYVLELAPDLEEEKVAEVFVRINSEGVTLNQADFILTLMSVFWDKGRVQLEAFARAAKKPSHQGPSPYNHFIAPGPDQLLRAGIGYGFLRGRLKNAYTVLRGKDMETGVYSPERRDEQFGVLADAQDKALDLTNWFEYLKCLMAAGYASGSTISSENSIVFNYIIYLVGRHRCGAPHGELRRLIARWFFMSTLTGRYTNSPESAIEEDLAWFRDVTAADQFTTILEQRIRAALTNDYWTITLPADLATSAARSPSLFAYYAALRLLGAKVLFSNLGVADLLDPAVKPKKAALDRHHLFPRGYLEKTLKVTDRRYVNQIANFALVEWSDNIDISDDPPSKYVPSYESKFTDKLGEQGLRDMYDLHALPAGWYLLGYDEFLDRRRRLMADVIRRGFETIT